MKTFFASVLIAIAVAFGGWLFACVMADNSSHSLELGAINGWAIYLCCVVVTCTRVILSRISKKESLPQ